MTGAIGPHEPSAEFRAHLEWQIETALRRESRLTAPVVPRLPRLRTALIVVAALAIGGAGGMATGYAQTTRERDRLIESARSEESLVRLRLDLVRAESQEARRRVDVGAAGRETLLAAEDQVRTFEAALARVHLDIEEIRATSAAPRNDLQAPLVGGRDFVRERLMLDLETAQRALAAAEQEAAGTQKRFDVGVVPRAAVLQAEADVARARTRMQLLTGTLDLRQRALRGEIKRDDLAVSIRRLELTMQLQQAHRELELGRGRLEEARRLVAIGQASDLDVKRAELHVLEQETELQRIQQQLAALAGARK